MVSWSGPRTAPCSTCLPVPIRAPKPCRWGSVSFLAVFRVGCLALSTGCFLFGVGFVLGRFIHRPAVHTTCSLITCSLLYECEGVWYKKIGCCEGVWYKELDFIVRVFGYGKLP